MTQTQTLILGISGKAETGKDHLARTCLYPIGYRPWSLAWHFKVWAVGRGLFTYEEVFETNPPHVRKRLQEMGTEEGRKVHGESVWCDTARAWMRLLAEQWGQGLIVIPDVRFRNEVDLVHSMGGRVVRMVAPKRAEASRLTPEARAHESETALDGYEGFDWLVHNDFAAIYPLWLQMRGFLSWYGRDDLAALVPETVAEATAEAAAEAA